MALSANPAACRSRACWPRRRLATVPIILPSGRGRSSIPLLTGVRSAPNSNSGILTCGSKARTIRRPDHAFHVPGMSLQMSQTFARAGIKNGHQSWMCRGEILSLGPAGGGKQLPVRGPGDVARRSIHLSHVGRPAFAETELIGVEFPKRKRKGACDRDTAPVRRLGQAVGKVTGPKFNQKSIVVDVENTDGRGVATCMFDFGAVGEVTSIR